MANEGIDEVASYESIENESAKAYLIKFDEDRIIWMAKSVVWVDEDDKEVTMPKWLYDKHFI